MTPTESAISAAVTRLYLDTFGKGPLFVQTLCHEDMAITLLRDVLTPGEETLIGAGKSASVMTTRMEWQRVTQTRFKSSVGEAAGRPVTAAISGFEVDDGLATEVFLFAPDVEPR
jgi:uncharacterized protein YbcI